jgi:hypothetical protein
MTAPAEPAATMAAAAAPASTAAMTATTATAAAAAPTARQAHAAAKVFSIEHMEGGQTDVGHFLFAKNEALIGSVIAGLRNIGSGHRGRGCIITHQRKT